MKRLFLLTMLVLLVLIVGCSSTPNAPEKIEGASVNGPLERTNAGEDMLFGVQVAKDGDPIGIYFSAQVNKGSLRAQLFDLDGKTVWSETAKQGNYAFNTTFVQTRAGTYKLGIAWDEPVQAQYELIWKPHMIETPTVSALALLPGVGMFLVGLGFVLYALLKRLGWKYLLLGAGFWILTVAVKFALAIPLNPPLYNMLKGTLGLPGELIFDLWIGALTGITEVGITYAILSRRNWGRVTWGKALAFGIGFGAVEAILLSINPLVSALAAMFSPNLLPLTAIQSLQALNNVAYGFTPVWERFFTIWCHILSNVLIFYAIVVRQQKWFWLAFLFKTVLDAIAGYAQVSGILTGSLETTIFNMWIIEALMGLLGIVGVWGTLWVKARYPGQPDAVPAEAVAPQATVL